MVHIDENGDAEGNYTVIALKPHPVNRTEYGLYPVAMFSRLQPNVRNLPVIYSCNISSCLNLEAQSVSS